jgi:hypothetical protein
METLKKSLYILSMLSKSLFPECLVLCYFGASLYPGNRVLIKPLGFASMAYTVSHRDSLKGIGFTFLDMSMI